MSSDEPHNEAEFLQRESRLAREALKRLRGDALESLKRTADPAAWTERYPWQSLGTAAVAGMGAGWALGSAFRQKPAAATLESSSGGIGDDESGDRAAAEKPNSASRLMAGLGTMTGALASAAFTAAAEAVSQMVRESIHDALHPEESAPDEPCDQADEGDSVEN
jgi:hypothetical protein